MCGVFAQFLNRPLTREDIELGRRAVELQAHRGPDDSGEWFDEASGVYLGHTRLSIIDLSDNSSQPMSRDGAVISYNGEIYNYKQISRDLEKSGARFSSSGDTEVLLKSWQLGAEKTLERVDGMFAFAIWDGQDGHLVVDPFGEKHLFVAETRDGIYVASELSTLSAVLEVTIEDDPVFWTSYMALGYIELPATGYKNIKRLLPATRARINKGRIVDEKRYWQWTMGEMGRGAVEPLTENDIDQIQDALASSLERRLISDAPLALFLSSGVDSSLAAALCSCVLDKHPDTLTVSFSDAFVNDEAPRARAIAEFLSLDHTILNSEATDFGTSPQDLEQMFAQPVETLTAFSVRQISSAARSRVKVAITGMGGDEVTFGYGKYSHVYENSKYYDKPEWVRRLMGAVAAPFSGYDPRFEMLSHNVGIFDHERIIALKNIPTLPALRRLPGFDEWARKVFPSKGNSLAADISSFEVDRQMPGLRLTSLDVASMRESIELRTPFLSRELTDTIANFDPRSFMAFGQKSVLRRILARFLPRELTDSPKQGFTYPQQRFLKTLSEDMPSSLPFDDELTKVFWINRHAGRGWNRCAVRLSLLSSFIERHSHNNAANP
jgi:asparagine synthase (glutamine-hydrolysing)